MLYWPTRGVPSASPASVRGDPRPPSDWPGGRESGASMAAASTGGPAESERSRSFASGRRSWPVRSGRHLSGDLIGTEAFAGAEESEAAAEEEIVTGNSSTIP